MPDRADGKKAAAGKTSKSGGKTTAGTKKIIRNDVTGQPARSSATAARRPAGNAARRPAGNAARRPAATAPPAAAQLAASASGAGPASPSGARLDVRKTYKLFIGGAFPRSESGRSYPVRTPGGDLLANAARASRKDARDAVRAARGAFGRWSGATAYNRGQVLYRVAEMLEGRAAQFEAEVGAAEGARPRAARDQVAAAIDRWVWYAGWTDKVAQVTGAANPVAGPYVNFSVPEPSGVAAIIAPPESSLLGLVSVLAPVIATGNTAVLVASPDRPLPAITLAEVLATSDVPGGVVNVLTGYTAELAPVLAGHMDVDAIDLSGAGPEAAAELERLAAANLKRVLRPVPGEDWAAPPGTRRLTAFLEIKTFWHPAGI